MTAPVEVRRLVTIGGGVPVVLDGVPIAGVGVSGGHYTQDAEIAEATASLLLLQSSEKRDERSVP